MHNIERMYILHANNNLLHNIHDFRFFQVFEIFDQIKQIFASYQFCYDIDMGFGNDALLEEYQQGMGHY